METNFNREQRRKLKKRLSKSGISVDMAIELLDRRFKEMNADPIEPGTKVQLNYDHIINSPGYTNRQQAYKDFVETNRDRIFTAAYDDKHQSGKIVCFNEDKSDQKWLWYASDLIVVNPEKESDSDSSNAAGTNGENTEIS